ncbi:hypothetical protein TNCV_3461631 [Trichonephila clavipes]|nr:hypothetical protein TNCV_3461631 [Trichonephila clavipes]
MPSSYEQVKVSRESFIASLNHNNIFQSLSKRSPDSEALKLPGTEFLSTVTTGALTSPFHPQQLFSSPWDSERLGEREREEEGRKEGRLFLPRKKGGPPHRLRG